MTMLRIARWAGLFSLAAVTAATANPKWVKPLEDLSASIEDSRAVTDKSGLVLEELRKDLFKAAVMTRDAKRLADELARQREEGDMDAAELTQLRLDITQATAILRDLHTHLNDFGKAIEAQDKRVERMEEDVEKAIAQARKRIDDDIAHLKAELAAARADSVKSRRGETTEGSGKSGKASSADVKNRRVQAALDDAMTALAAGKLAEAQAGFESLLANHPDLIEAKLGLASCHFEEARYDESRQLVEAVLDTDKRNPWALGIEGAILYREGKLRAARKALEKAVKLDESNPYNLNYLAVVQFESGRTEQALETMQRAIAVDPSYLSALYNHAVMLISLEEPDLAGAREYYEKSIELGGPRDAVMDQRLNLP